MKKTTTDQNEWINQSSKKVYLWGRDLNPMDIGGELKVNTNVLFAEKHLTEYTGRHS